jgi:asparagine synthase (glutamine-hydrolysing)
MRNQLLRDTDWASMAHGLEVRVPLVDSVLLRRMAALTGGTALSDANALKSHLALSPSAPLPDRVVRRAKTGFTTPIAQWLQGELMNAAPRVVTGHKMPRSVHWSRQWAERLAAA